MTAKPQVLVLGGNFAGLASAQRIRDYAADFTLIDRCDQETAVDAGG